jgi:Holliday junction DNA helicase RuvB
MTREPILEGDGEEHEKQDRALRPSRMSDMVGQRQVRERLQIAVDAALKRNDPLGHILFDGPPGLGKTTFAYCLPRELGVDVNTTTGPALTAPKDLLPYLTNASDRSILFIDEIHRLPMAVEEYLYTAMEDYRIDIVLGDGTNARTLNITLAPFTLIGATTRVGLLTAPLRDRFHIREHLEFYTDDELAEIVRRSAKKLDVEIDDPSAMDIALRSRGTPRVANNHLRWVRDYATAKADGVISLEVTHAALKMAAVDSIGLRREDRKYLEVLIKRFLGGPAGVEAIAHTMNSATDTLEEEIEPFLLRTGLVVRTPRGRVARAGAYEHLKIDPPAQDPGDNGQTSLF